MYTESLKSVLHITCVKVFCITVQNNTIKGLLNAIAIKLEESYTDLYAYFTQYTISMYNIVMYMYVQYTISF